MKRVTYFIQFFSLRGVHTENNIFVYRHNFRTYPIVYIIIYIISEIRQQHVLKWPAVSSYSSEIHILYCRDSPFCTHIIHKYTNRPYLPENNVCCPFFFLLFSHHHHPPPPTPRANVYTHTFILLYIWYFILCARDLIVVDSAYCVHTYYMYNIFFFRW